MFNLFTELPVPALAIVLSVVTVAVTQITSNTATSTIFLPIVAQLVSAPEPSLWWGGGGGEGGGLVGSGCGNYCARCFSYMCMYM